MGVTSETSSYAFFAHLKPTFNFQISHRPLHACRKRMVGCKRKLSLLLLLSVPLDLTGLASVQQYTPHRNPAQSPLHGLHRLRRAGDQGPGAAQRKDKEEWLSLESEEGSVSEYKGRNLKELFDAQLRFGGTDVAVASHRAPEQNGTAPPGVWNERDEDEHDAEYELRMKIGRLKLAAQVAVANGQLKEAHRMYSKCLSELPNDPGVLANRALLSLRLGCAQEAEEDCTVALHLTGRRDLVAKLLYRRAMARRERGRMSQALKDALAAAQHEPRSPKIAELVQQLQRDEPLLRPGTLSSNHSVASPPALLPKVSATGASALLKWAGLDASEGGSPDACLSHRNKNDQLFAADTIRSIMRTTRCSELEAREALFQCEGGNVCVWFCVCHDVCASILHLYVDARTKLMVACFYAHLL
jgi:tetratricopeptide (TPR) repeat protein